MLDFGRLACRIRCRAAQSFYIPGPQRKRVSMVNLVVELVAGVLVGTILMHVSAKIADVDDATLLRALEAAGIGIILVVVSDMVYPLWGIAFALMVEIAVIKVIYDTMLSKAGLILFLVIVFFSIGLIIGLLLYRWAI